MGALDVATAVRLELAGVGRNPTLTPNPSRSPNQLAGVGRNPPPNPTLTRALTNGQMCHSIIAAEGGNGYAAATDDTCGDAPRLLHFNCGRAFKELTLTLTRQP